MAGKQSHHVGGSVDAGTSSSGLKGLDFTGVEPAKGSPGIGVPANVHTCQRQPSLRDLEGDRVQYRMPKGRPSRDILCRRTIDSCLLNL